MKISFDSSKEKWPPPAPTSPWDRMRWTLSAARENGVAGRVLLAIVSHADAQGKAWPSHPTIAKHVYGRSGPDQVRQVRRGIAWLVEHGWLTVDPNAHRTGSVWTNVYQLRGRVNSTQRGVDPRQGTLDPPRGVISPRQEGENSPTQGDGLTPQTAKEDSFNGQRSDDFPYDDFVELLLDAPAEFRTELKELYVPWRTACWDFDTQKPLTEAIKQLLKQYSLLENAGWYDLDETQRNEIESATERRLLPVSTVTEFQRDLRIDKAQALIVCLALFGSHTYGGAHLEGIVDKPPAPNPTRVEMDQRRSG